ncbi:hypothetical protein [Paenibacillus larvae]|uniref:Uncharacterized protein n=1 Tax=Paenibacillus larvae subsp. larvae TaxID=147375 RepID=A0A6C0QMK1_9BACL|nr:hypothetical protein [Paenibacillus larvae]QHZ49927.1 hypothetical protein ERICV_00746 [Paenibacillus larvae subsp. larvae]
MAEKQIASITLKVDVSEALTGLKALTREARKATAALAELREAMKEQPYKHIPDTDDVLDKREMDYLNYLAEASVDRE